MVSGHIDHLKACKDAGIKPILGTETYCTFEPAHLKLNRHNSHMVIWAKNKDGLKDLWSMISRTNEVDYFYFKPRIFPWNFTDKETNIFYPGIEYFAQNGNLMAFSGHQGSILSDSLFADLYGDPEQRKKDIRQAYNQKKNINDPSYFKQFLKSNWLDSTCELAIKLEKVFGKGNFFIELQNELNPKDQLALWIHPLIVDCLREVSKSTGIMALASSDPHYPTIEDAEDQRLMVMSNLKETEESVEKKLNDENENDVMVFFGSNAFHIHPYEEMAIKFSEEELENTNKIADLVESYDISAQPQMPIFKIPPFDKDNIFLKDAPTDADKYLLHLCIEGAKSLKPWDSLEWENKNKKASKEDYWDRLQHEIDIVYKAKLSNYFLVVQDYCKAADFRPADHSFDWQNNLKNKGYIDAIPRSPGRGSAAGCLISYLIGITGIDPLIYDLIFARFFNFGRLSEGHIELPDIDIDFAVEGRDWVIEYIKYKYGANRVAQMITFQTIKGKAAIKDVMRVKNVIGGFDLANEISKFIPDEASVADELQAMKNAGHENYGLIQWALDNNKDIVDYYENPKFKPLFKQAMKCEGVKKSSGKHPSGIIVIDDVIDNKFPMALDTKTKQKIVGVDMNAAAKLGAVKMDILGTCILDKMKMCEDLVNGINRDRTVDIEYIEDDE